MRHTLLVRRKTAIGLAFYDTFEYAPPIVHFVYTSPKMRSESRHRNFTIGPKRRHRQPMPGSGLSLSSRWRTAPDTAPPMREDVAL